MYNLWNRVNAVFFYGLTALFLAAAASNVTCVARGTAVADAAGGSATHPSSKATPAASQQGGVHS